MQRYTVLVVDDEMLSRRRIRRLLSLEPDCEVLAECDSGAAAIRALDEHRPDLLFLDIQMPEINGFAVVEAITRPRPLVIFTSAWDDYAVRAFEVHAFDYLMKPFDRRRFREALHRARTHLSRERLAPAEPAPVAPDPFASARRAPDRVAVRSSGRVVFLKIDEIDWIEACDNYVNLHCGKENHLLRETMAELEARLDPARFIRVHRSAIVNLDRIRELQPWFRGDYRVILRDGTELTLTRTHREKLESRLLLGA